MDPQYYPFQYTIDPQSDDPIMLIDKHIGWDKDDGQGIDGALFQKELLVLDGMEKNSIQVRINSPGGNVSDGWNIYSAILKSITKVDTYCIGMAASIAAVIFQAGRKRIIADYGFLMYHNPFDTDGSETEEDKKSLDAFRDSLIRMISTRSGMSEKKVSEMMNRTSFIDADESIKMGLCDEVEESVELNKKRLSSLAGNIKASWQESNKILNSLKIKNSFNMATPKIANKLNLISEASEDAIVEAITDIKNKLSKSEKDCKDKEKELEDHKKDMDDKKDEIEKHKKDLKDMKDKHDKLKDELDEMKKKATEDEDTRKKEFEAKKAKDAKDMIAGFVKEGRIKNDPKIIADWEADATIDFDKVKNRIESLPLNKVAAKNLADAVIDKGNAKLGSVIANAMANNLVKALEHK